MNFLYTGENYVLRRGERLEINELASVLGRLVEHGDGSIAYLTRVCRRNDAFVQTMITALRSSALKPARNTRHQEAAALLVIGASLHDFLQITLDVARHKSVCTSM
jgi:hypothetical protein